MPATDVATREVFWNVAAHWLIYPLMIIALALFGYGFYRRIRYWRLGKPDNERFGNNGQRIKDALLFAMLQWRIVKEKYPGLIHVCIFIGFVLLFIGTVVVSFDYDIWGLILRQSSFLKGNFYKIFSLVLDIAGLVAIIGVLLALVRRYIQRPKRLNNLRDDAVILVGLLFILVVGFLVEGARIAATNPEWEVWSVVGWRAAKLFSPENATAWHRLLWWVHLVTAFAFIAYIPFSKLIHIFTSAANIYFRSLTPKGALPFMDLDKAESFGAGKITDFSWKHLLDLDACTRCGRCQDQCPAYLSGKPLSPKKIVLDLLAKLNEDGRKLLSGQTLENNPPLVGSAVAADEIWACTTCRACIEACPVFIEHVDKIVELRRDRVLMESDFPTELTATFKGMENNFNPWNIGFASRADWAAGLPVKRIDQGEQAEYLWFVGCAGSYDDRIKKVSVSFAKILAKAKVDVGILGVEERCCGETARRLGNEYLAQTLMQMNIETFNRFGVKKIITFCPHGYNTLKYEYPQFNGRYEVFHATEFLEQLIQSGQLQLQPRDGAKITYHDSCYLGRYSDIYRGPRSVLAATTNAPIIELKRNHQRSFCCGAGGGRMWLEESIGQRINNIRTDEILQSEAEIVATACPYCLTMFTDGLKDKGMTEKINALDIIEIVERTMV
ncbi:MAG: heterodisulfide reductase-related iron-sulfur binding cluster [candidate division KSB1 bacterium]|nr:heterodisulfide reductase-related iron-sulfur binding cluster [candidate division KSB1 bacterium]